jgi:hypothetical protein
MHCLPALLPSARIMVAPLPASAAPAMLANNDGHVLSGQVIAADPRVSVTCKATATAGRSGRGRSLPGSGRFAQKLTGGLVCSRLHLWMQSRYNQVMSSSTVGFAVADEDQERLARLVEHFGGGNRSAYLRATLPVMESLARAERLRELQARNAERAAAAGHDYESLLAEIRQAYKGGARGR